MSDEEYQDEIRRRDEIIDSLNGIVLDNIRLQTKIDAVKNFVKNLHDADLRKWIKAVLDVE